MVVREGACQRVLVVVLVRVVSRSRARAIFVVRFARGAMGVPPEVSESLREAARQGDAVTVGALLDAGAPADAIDAEGGAAMHYALGSGRCDVAKVLLDHSASVNVRDATQTTPLHVAAAFLSADVCSMLLEARAGVAAQDEKGCRRFMSPLWSKRA